MNVVENTKSLLFVDDQKQACMLGKRFLENHSYQVTTVCSGEEAIILSEKNEYDLIILDLMMPHMSGYEVCEQLRCRATTQFTPILIMTGDDSSASIEKSFDAGATDFISKPIHWDVLHHRIRYLLRTTHTTQMLRSTLKELDLLQNYLDQSQSLANIGQWTYEVSSETLIFSNSIYSIFGIENVKSHESLDDLLNIIHRDDRENIKSEIMLAIESNIAYTSEHRVINPHGTIYTVRHHIASFISNEQKIICGTLHNISEKKNIESELIFMSAFDPLTQLPNRKNFTEVLKTRLEEAVRYHQKLAVISLDIDNFKRINDNFGHSAGDQFLSDIAKKIQETLRQSDCIGYTNGSSTILSRFSGDEFSILLTNIDNESNAAKVCERIIHDLSVPLMINNIAIVTTASFGISIYPNDGADVETLIKNANIAMYDCKASGRNFYHYYNETMQSETVKQLEIESQLRHAIEENELIAFLQPQYNFISNQISGFELLLRWNNLALGFVPPNMFIPIAEKSGLIKSIGEWVIKHACDYLRQLNQHEIFITIAVNVSAIQLRAEDFVEFVKKTITQNGILPWQLEIELTESTLMENPDKCIRKLNELHDFGLHIAIDDFGTGYSSLASLKKLPIHILKIDKSFIDDVETSELDRGMIKAIIAMAHNLNIQVVAEGVETVGQFNFIRSENCDAMQGYYIAKPMPFDQAYEFISNSANSFNNAQVYIPEVCPSEKCILKP